MVAQCTAHSQLKSVYGVSRVTCHHTPGPPIKVSGRDEHYHNSECTLNVVLNALLAAVLNALLAFCQQFINNFDVWCNCASVQ